MGTTEITVTPGTQQVVITREFDAPRELVFRTYTEPDLFVQWMGPRNLTTTVEQFDVREGGVWRYVAMAPDGSEHRFHGVFHGDPSPERIVQTFEYEGAPTHVSLETAVFTESEGRTRVTATAVFQSPQDRDAMVASGMESGARESYERLGELLVTLHATGSASV